MAELIIPNEPITDANIEQRRQNLLDFLTRDITETAHYLMGEANRQHARGELTDAQHQALVDTELDRLNRLNDSTPPDPAGAPLFIYGADDELIWLG